ncbi:origin recognition complex subunit 2 [Vespa velutina]|uniref:origin recognition complex subunit 2 n=1 Tax=Vespa velutina TaxID=202808 RepID=UPI001FB3A171|nr:origin recognition complex subunit 2 [Vespa velutina]XP_047358630.1 origin recognition complex subunit 2 [Vespa velutina]
MAQNNENLRRSTRIKALSKSENIETNKGNLQDNLIDSTIREKDLLQEEIKEQIENIDKDIHKPIELFSENDVSGKNMYQFETPKKDGMVQKAYLSRKSFDMQKTRIYKDKTNKDTDVKNSTINKSINKRKTLPEIEIISSDSESVSEESEFVPSEDETSTKSEYESSDYSDLSNDENFSKQSKLKTIQHRSNLESKLITTPRRSETKYKTPCKDYHIKTDEYFENQSQKVVTSNHTLARLRNSRFTRDKLQELLGNQNHIKEEHKKLIYSLSEDYREFFPMWYFIMEEGYTLLLHGLGSKRNLINDFHNQFISNHPTLVIDGFFPSLTIKDILDGIITDILELNVPANITECIELIKKILKKNPKDRLYLLIHNIDGIMLRSNKAQDTLSTLARISNLCIMGSIDHINAPLLWDHMKHSKYNFYWWDATTLLPYEAETSYESSLLIQHSGALALSSLRNVFLSLTSNARAIYKLLIQYQLDNSNASDFSGMAFKDLYRISREGFLVSTDLALRAQLTEFIDHKLVRTKRNKDGTECLIIPLNNNLLKQFLEQHEN